MTARWAAQNQYGDGLAIVIGEIQPKLMLLAPTAAGGGARHMQPLRARLSSQC